MRQQREAQVHDEALRLAEFAASDLKGVLAGAHTLLISLASAPAIRNHAPAACDSLLAELGAHLPQYAALGAADRAGTWFCSWGGDPPWTDDAVGNAALPAAGAEPGMHVGTLGPQPGGWADDPANHLGVRRRVGAVRRARRRRPRSGAPASPLFDPDVTAQGLVHDPGPRRDAARPGAGRRAGRPEDPREQPLDRRCRSARNIDRAGARRRRPGRRLCSAGRHDGGWPGGDGRSIGAGGPRGHGRRTAARHAADSTRPLLGLGRRPCRRPDVHPEADRRPAARGRPLARRRSRRSGRDRQPAFRVRPTGNRTRRDGRELRCAAG